MLIALPEMSGYFFPGLHMENILKIAICIACIRNAVQHSTNLSVFYFRAPTGVAVNFLVFTCSFTNPSIHLT